MIIMIGNFAYMVQSQMAPIIIAVVIVHTNYNSLSIIIYHDLLGFHCILKIIVAAPIKLIGAGIKPPPALSFYKLIEAAA